MEERIKNRYNPEILSQALVLYDIDPNQIQALDGFESFIYEFDHAAGSGILRISHSLRRTPNLILGELDWIQYLHAGGARVAPPKSSVNGQLVEEIDDQEGGSFLAAAFERAEGEPHRGEEWSDSLLCEYGKLLGRIHQLSRDYLPADPAWRRPVWDDPIMLEVEAFIPKNERRILNLYEELCQYLYDLPKNAGSYGLIHQDAHRGNFFVNDEGRITLFDFDDCVYSWYINDIALVLFYAVMGQDDPGRFVREFLAGFLPGYYSQVQLDPSWFREITHFMKLREIDLYAVIHRSFDLENLEDPWCRWYMEGRREKLETSLPYLDFDFQSFQIDSYLK
jgi:Ser/Thr protein kinase RdoA (MazF antagonist)